VPPPIPGAPATFFAETRDERIAIVSTSSGDVVRFLTDSQPGGGAGGFSTSPDGNTLYFSRGDGTCAGHVAQIDLVNGGETAVPGASPPTNAVDSGLSVRPDGGAVAFGRYHCDTRVTDLVIVPISGAPTTEVVGAGLGGPLGPRSWLPDGSQLIVANEDLANGTIAYSTIDVAATGAIAGQHPIETPAINCLFFINLVEPSSGLLISTVRCGQQGATDQSTLVEYDPAARRVARTLVTGAPGQILGPITLDSSDRYLLYEIDASPPADAVISSSSPLPPSEAWALVDGLSTRFPQGDAYLSISW
jgi:hypothetical protein